eukprot:scaffold55449_cov72-Phaeocystis_antarctica.AAC.1
MPGSLQSISISIYLSLSLSLSEKVRAAAAERRQVGKNAIEATAQSALGWYRPSVGVPETFGGYRSSGVLVGLSSANAIPLLNAFERLVFPTA